MLVLITWFTITPVNNKLLHFNRSVKSQHAGFLLVKVRDTLKPVFQTGPDYADFVGW